MFKVLVIVFNLVPYISLWLIQSRFVHYQTNLPTLQTLPAAVERLGATGSEWVVSGWCVYFECTFCISAEKGSINPCKITI